MKLFVTKQNNTNKMKTQLKLIHKWNKQMKNKRLKMRKNTKINKINKKILKLL